MIVINLRNSILAFKWKDCWAWTFQGKLNWGEGGEGGRRRRQIALSHCNWFLEFPSPRLTSIWKSGLKLGYKQALVIYCHEMSGKFKFWNLSFETREVAMKWNTPWFEDITKVHVDAERGQIIILQTFDDGDDDDCYDYDAWREIPGSLLKWSHEGATQLALGSLAHCHWPPPPPPRNCLVCQGVRGGERAHIYV